MTKLLGRIPEQGSDAKILSIKNGIIGTKDLDLSSLVTGGDIKKYTNITDEDLKYFGLDSFNIDGSFCANVTMSKPEGFVFSENKVIYSSPPIKKATVYYYGDGEYIKSRTYREGRDTYLNFLVKGLRLDIGVDIDYKNEGIAVDFKPADIDYNGKIADASQREGLFYMDIEFDGFFSKSGATFYANGGYSKISYIVDSNENLLSVPVEYKKSETGNSIMRYLFNSHITLLSHFNITHNGVFHQNLKHKIPIIYTSNYPSDYIKNVPYEWFITNIDNNFWRINQTISLSKIVFEYDLNETTPGINFTIIPAYTKLRKDKKYTLNLNITQSLRIPNVYWSEENVVRADKVNFPADFYAEESDFEGTGENGLYTFKKCKSPDLRKRKIDDNNPGYLNRLGNCLNQSGNPYGFTTSNYHSWGTNSNSSSNYMNYDMYNINYLIREGLSFMRTFYNNGNMLGFRDYNQGNIWFGKEYVSKQSNTNNICGGGIRVSDMQSPF